MHSCKKNHVNIYKQYKCQWNNGPVQEIGKKNAIPNKSNARPKTTRQEVGIIQYMILTLWSCMQQQGNKSVTYK